MKRESWTRKALWEGPPDKEPVKRKDREARHADRQRRLKLMHRPTLTPEDYKKQEEYRERQRKGMAHVYKADNERLWKFYGTLYGIGFILIAFARCS